MLTWTVDLPKLPTVPVMVKRSTSNGPIAIPSSALGSGLTAGYDDSGA
ncbi:MAG: hypothetical protein ACRENP_24480 [Longimicrobiales bacterium]